MRLINRNCWRGNRIGGDGLVARVMRPLVLLLLLCSVMSTVAVAQKYPSRPIRMITATTVGSGPDVIARLLAARLTESLGQQIVVDNRAGASGLIGAELVARAAPDGHTLWMATMTQLISTTLYQRFVMSKEFAPVGQVASTPFVIAVSAGVPTIMETVPGYELVGWYGLLAPLGTPKDIVTKLNSAFAQVLKLAEVQERLLGVGAEAIISTPADFGLFLKNETQRWTRVMREAGIKAQ